MQKVREVIVHQKQYFMIDPTILSFKRHDIKSIKNECVCLGNHSKIPAKQQKIFENQSCLKSVLSIKKAYLLLFSCNKQLKCFFSLLFFSYFLYYYNIIYNKYIISNTKLNKVNLVIKIK